MAELRSRLNSAGTLPADLTFTPGTIAHTIGVTSAGDDPGAALNITGAATDGTGGSDAGNVNITGGAAGAITGANGGSVAITGGNAAGFSTGGHVTITGGSAGGTGGNVTLAPGTGLGTGSLRLGSTVSCQVVLGHVSGTLAFYGGAGITRPTITGSRSTPAALTDLLTKLAATGLLIDSTTA